MNKTHGDFKDKTFPYEFSIASNAEAEILNDKMDVFIGNQISYHGDVEVLKNYVIKDNGTIIAGIRSCFYFGKCVVINVLFVEEQHRHKGLGSLLLNKVETEAKATGASLIHLDTFDFQAKDFYLKNGYEIFAVLNNCPPGHERYYMRKTFSDHDDKITPRKITRIGVYGVVMEGGKMLVVRQKRGPYAGKLDFPGGGIEFGESAKQALCREFAEEVGMEFDSVQLIDNLTATINVPKPPSNEPYSFYQIGMIYRVNGLQSIFQGHGELQYVWIDPNTLSKERCSSLLWQFLKSHLTSLNNKNVEVIPYDCQVHDKSTVEKLLSHSLYCTDEEKVNASFQGYTSGNRHLFISVYDHKIIGVIGFDKFGTILHITVDPEYRRKGIAKQMIEAISQKFSKLAAETDKEGIEFYKACGFKIESLGELYPGTERFKCTKQISRDHDADS